MSPGTRARSTRVAIVDEIGAVLFIRSRDPATPDVEYLVLPGGTPKPDETLENAALREVREEVGVALERLDVCLGSVDAEFEFAGRHYLKREEVFMVRVARVDLEPALQKEGFERFAVGIGWWRIDEALQHGFVLYPPQLANLLRD